MGHLLPCSKLGDFAMRSFPYIYISTKTAARHAEISPAKPVTASARMANIRLIYSGSHCGTWNEPGARESRPNGRDSKKASSPTRRSLYKFHESFEPYIFSLSSRFARHVLLKYDNFTRGAGTVPFCVYTPTCLLFLSRFGAPREILICFCLPCLRVKLDLRFRTLLRFVTFFPPLARFIADGI